MWTRTTLAAGLALLGAGLAHPAQAQDVRVQVTIPRDVVRDVRQALEAAFGPDLIDSLRDATHDAAWHAHVLADLVTGQDRNFRQVRSARETRTLEIGPNGWLELRNVFGDVTVTAGRRENALVEIVRESRGRTVADAERGLREVQVTVSDRGRRASVEVRQPPGVNQTYRVGVSYTVTVPIDTRLTIRSFAGDVSTTGVKGDQTIDVTSGAIQVRRAARISQASSVSGTVSVSDVETDGAIEVGSLAGRVLLERVQARRIDAKAVSADVVVRDVTSTEVSLSSFTGNVELTGVLRPQGRYDLQSVSGSIKLIVSPTAGFDLRADTFGGTLQIDPAFRQALTESRRAVRGVIGDGGAVVVLHSLSGVIAVIRR